jgi:hypothetical protein
MVWPITGAESYVQETGKSMNAQRVSTAQKDHCRKISIALIEPVVGVIACYGKRVNCVKLCH